MGFIAPWHKVVCPSCGTDFYPGSADIVSGLNPNNVMQTAPTHNVLKVLSRFWITATKGRKYTRQLAGRQCPNTDCKRVLPYNIERAKSYTIAIIGDGSAGKSHYIASCIHLLKQRQALQLIGCSRIVGWGKTEAIYQSKFYQPVFGNLQPIPLTPRARSEINEPLIYELIFKKEAWWKPAKSVNLFFYDASGEDLAEQDRMVQYSSYVLNASAIIFLADPLTMPNIVKALPSDLKPGAIRERSSSEVLNRITETFRMGQGLDAGASIDIPVAIALSKADLLKYVVRSQEATTQFLRETTSTNRLNTADFATINEEVQKLILRVGDKVLVQSSELFNTASFFAVSATGWAPDKGKYPAIEPLRCLDPLLWILWKLNVIEAE
ncbi:hypothetical protein KDA_67170 [Dictyobacter alpinus]|uniref:Double-GTPase 2 domain-containing protein n=2 Tax=Dictyobacter alpinus TaxID=2014873 RepID=A0A402BIM8_9CHLR|nr:hypothetical protein KDA_67170 [Dictyobacter alpinus]